MRHDLLLIQCETLLPPLYTRVVIPTAVWHALQDLDTPPTVRGMGGPAVCMLCDTAPPAGDPCDGDAGLRGGECEAIGLAQELHADIGLIDAGDGRWEAQRRALTMTGTLGVLERAAIRGLIGLPRALARLQTTTFRAQLELSHDLLARDTAQKSQRAN